MAVNAGTQNTHHSDPTASGYVRQGDPFVHSSHFIELLHHPAMLGPVQTMSRVYKREGEEDVRTPVDMVDATSKNPWFKSEVGFHSVVMSARSMGGLKFRCT